MLLHNRLLACVSLCHRVKCHGIKAVKIIINSFADMRRQVGNLQESDFTKLNC